MHNQDGTDWALISTVLREGDVYCHSLLLGERCLAEVSPWWAFGNMTLFLTEVKMDAN
jgi:hypothetical protein